MIRKLFVSENCWCKDGWNQAEKIWLRTLRWSPVVLTKFVTKKSESRMKKKTCFIFVFKTCRLVITEILSQPNVNARVQCIEKWSKNKFRTFNEAKRSDEIFVFQRLSPIFVDIWETSMEFYKSWRLSLTVRSIVWNKPGIEFRSKINKWSTNFKL